MEHAGLAATLTEHRTGLPAAVLLVLIGLVYGLLPGPNVTLDPELVLVLVLPPLLDSAAPNASLVEIRANLRSVLSLSVALVLATTLAVGLGVAAVVRNLPLPAAMALGAAVAPPDPVASLAVGRRAGLPPRLPAERRHGADCLRGRSDRRAWRRVLPVAAGGRLLVAAAGGLAVGLAVAWLVRLVRRRRDDPIVDNVLSLATPFLSYVAAEQVHVSGVLAVVVAGHQAPVLLSSASSTTRKDCCHSRVADGHGREAQRGAAQRHAQTEEDAAVTGERPAQTTQGVESLPAAGVAAIAVVRRRTPGTSRSRSRSWANSSGAASPL